jgi:hypothetical protein
MKRSTMQTLLLTKSNEDDDVTGNERKFINIQSGVLLEIRKEAVANDLRCHIFIVSDALFNFVNRDLQSIQY